MGGQIDGGSKFLFLILVESLKMVRYWVERCHFLLLLGIMILGILAGMR